MKLVAAAKVRRAQDAVLATRPFSETLQSVFGGLISRIGSEAADLPLLSQREVKKVTLCVITGDRGLCGGYNSFMIKKAESRFKELQAAGIDCDMVLIGGDTVTDSCHKQEELYVRYTELYILITVFIIQKFKSPNSEGRKGRKRVQKSVSKQNCQSSSQLTVGLRNVVSISDQAPGRNTTNGTL